MDNDHAHDFGQPEPGTARMCSQPDCTEWGVCASGTWTPPTRDQQTQIGLIMWEDTIMADVFRVIHGEGGPEKYRRRVYGD